MKKMLLLLFVFPVCVCGQSRIYVNQSATGQHTGDSWQDAFTDLQDAITTSQPGDEIWVGQGLYKPTTTTDRSISFQPKSGVKLYGGFAGDESTPEQRNWQNHHTILSGEIGVAGDSSDNSFNVVYLFEPDSNTVIDGFIIEDGNASNGGGQSFSFQRQFNGGGINIMCLNGQAYVQIRHCTFRRNAAQANGGGIMVYGGGTGSINNVVIQDCTFEQNRALFYGGGVFRIGGGMPGMGVNIERCSFYKNRAFTGGGIAYLDNNGLDTISINACTFLENTAANWGGGVYLSPERSTVTEVTIDSCYFKGNKAKSGAALDVFPINVVLYNGNINLTNSAFTQNSTTVQNGEGIVRIIVLGGNEVDMKVDSCTFETNKSASPGQPTVILESSSGELNFSNNIIDEDNALLTIGGFEKSLINKCLFIRGALNKVAILDGGFNFKLRNSVIIDKVLDTIGIEPINRTDKIQSVENCLFRIVTEPLVFGGGAGVLPPVKCTNSIFFNKNPNPDYLHADKHHLENCYVYSLDCSNPPFEISCSNSITSIDPLFINPDSNDYHLQPCSPLINAGTNAVIQPGDTDLDGNARIRGGTVDIGPYESAPLGLVAAPQTTGSCPGGSNGTVAFATDAACEPVLFNWSGPGGASGTALEQLSVGDYSITITDAKNDTLMATFTIPEGTPPQVVAQTTPVICGTTTGGTAMLDGANGTAPFSFDWGNGVVDSMVTGLAYGIYPVTITDASGCTASANIQIGRMGNLQVQIIKNDISCHDESDGSITIEPTNGTPPYEWLWQFNGSTAPDISDLAAGNYAGTMTDNLGCAINWIVPIENPDTIAANTEVTAATGPAIADGSILLVPSGGTGDFTAVWDNGANGVFINNLLPGFYTVTITDGNDCTQIVTVEVPWSSGTGEAGVREVRVWPNPAQEWVFVQPPAEFGTFIFYLTDVQGKAIRTLDRTNGSVFLIHTGDLPQGTYLWKMTGKNGSAGGKIVCIKQ